jgi:hypothetical protein
MKEEIKLRVLTPSEQKYTYKQSTQLSGQTGCIGYLRGDFDSSGDGFFTKWFDSRREWKTDGFDKILDEVINGLREENGLLHGRPEMERFVKDYPESVFKSTDCAEYGFRVDVEDHAFLFRCNPTQGDSNFYCYCYIKEWLDGHMHTAEQGISFVDIHSKELFRIPDGGRVVITRANGEKQEFVCRFIDVCHMEIGNGWNNLFHIDEFAERMAEIGSTYKPKDSMEPPARKAPKRNDYER